MKTRLILKTLFLILMLLFLVLLGMENRQTIDFALPKILALKIRLPAAIMYYTFFAIGVITGTVLSSGAKKSSAKSG